MAYKHTNPCLQKVGDDEPIFVLRAQDELAARVVRYWMYLYHWSGGAERHPEKYVEAARLADAMERWPGRKQPD